MPPKKMDGEPEAPKLVEVNISFSAGGKVELIDFGKITSDYRASMSRRFQIPEGWTAEQAKKFQKSEYDELRSEIDGRATDEYNERIDQSWMSK